MDPVSRAQNSVIGRPFKKGSSGNSGGRPKKPYITKILEDYFKKKNNRKDVETMIGNIFKGQKMASVLLLREAAERLEGKVSQIVDMNVSGTVTLEQVLEARKRAGKN
jgi:hypothetical protein